jgi:hypothetical protein
MRLFSNLNILPQSETIKALTAFFENQVAQIVALIIPLKFGLLEIDYFIK